MSEQKQHTNTKKPDQKDYCIEDQVIDSDLKNSDFKNNDLKNNDLKKNDLKKNEQLSAFIDAEQSDGETVQIIDALLKEPEYKAQYIRRQLINDQLHEQAQFSPLFVASVFADASFTDLRSNISLALDALPAHFSDAAVALQAGKTEDIPRSSVWQAFFKKAVDNKMLSGLSVAASVMFVTLFTLQNFNTISGAPVDTSSNHFADSGDTLYVTPVSDDSVFDDSVSDDSALANSNLSTPIPSFIQYPSALPASFVSTSAVLADVSNQDLKQQYQWIEADPVLSRQVRQYINEHETGRAAYNLQPKIRTATYQIND